MANSADIAQEGIELAMKAALSCCHREFTIIRCSGEDVRDSEESTFIGTTSSAMRFGDLKTRWAVGYDDPEDQEPFVRSSDGDMATELVRRFDEARQNARRKAALA